MLGVLLVGGVFLLNFENARVIFASNDSLEVSTLRTYLLFLPIKLYSLRSKLLE